MSADILHFVTVENAPNRIRELRMQAGISQQVLADRIGVSKVTISDLERGKMKLDTEYMRRIAYALDVQSADLLRKADNAAALSLEERHLIDRLRAANDEQREQVQRVADVLLPFRGHEAAGTGGRLRQKLA